MHSPVSDEQISRSLDRRRVKSLRDTLLEYVVLYAEEVLPNDEEPENRRRDESVALPSGLFERILLQSSDMGWAIRPRCLLSCLIRRNRLGWSDLTKFAQHFKLNSQQIDAFTSLMPPPRKLCVEVQLEKEGDFAPLEHFSRMADELEHLELRIPYLYRDRIVVKNTSGNESRATLKLKSFVYNANLESLPLSLDASTLLVLSLDNSILTKSSLEMIRRFKNLRSLSLFKSRLHMTSFDDVMNMILSQTDLRELNVAGMWTYPTGNYKIISGDELNKMMRNLPRLDRLEISRLDMDLSSVDSSEPERKLKVLIVEHSDDLDPEVLSRVALRAATLTNLEGVLTACEVTSNKALLRESYSKLLFLVACAMRTGSVDRTVTRRIERALMGFSACLHGLDRNAIICAGAVELFLIVDKFAHLFSYEFLTRMLCLKVTIDPDFYVKDSLRWRDHLKTYIQGNGNTHLAERLAKFGKFSY